MKLPLTLLILAASLSLTLAQPADRTGTLTAPAKIPIMANGAQIGAATAPAGTKIKVLKEEAGKVLVSAPAGQAWVDSASVTLDAPNQYVTAASPTQGVAANPPNIARPATSTPVPPTNAQPHKKRILFVPCYNELNQYEETLIETLKKLGAEVTLFSMWVTPNNETYLKKINISQIKEYSYYREVATEVGTIKPDNQWVNGSSAIPELLKEMDTHDEVVFTPFHYGKDGLSNAFKSILEKKIPITYGNTHPEFVEAAKTGIDVKTEQGGPILKPFIGPKISKHLNEIIYTMRRPKLQSEEKMNAFITELAKDILANAKSK